jgi:hypothetical protein
VTSRSAEATRARNTTAAKLRRRRVSVALGNPAALGEIYVRPRDENWNTHLPRVALEMLAFLVTTTRGVIVCPPEFLKTTMVSQLYPLFLTCRYAAAGKLGLLTGMLVSEEQDLAEANLSVLSWHIENNDLLRRDFIDTEGRPLIEPDPAADKWTDSEIVVRRPGALKDPTWSAKGLRAQGVQGKRIGHLLGDDVVTPLTAGSPARQREAKKLWDQQFMRRVLRRPGRPGGQAIIAGNFNHPRDLLETLATNSTWRVYRRPSLHVPGDVAKFPKSVRDPDAIEAYPEAWPRSRLIAEQQQSPATFMPVHALRTTTEGGTMLKEEWATIISRDQVPRGGRVLIGIDPAPGAEVDPDPSFFSITIGVLGAEHLDVIESIALRIETTEQVELIARKVKAFGPVSGIAVSKVSLDKYFRGAVLVGHPELRPFLHDHALGKTDKAARLSGLGAYAMNGWLRFTERAWTQLTSDPDTDRDQEESLKEQWIALPAQNHDDRLDSLDVLVRDAVAIGGAVAPIVSEADVNAAPGSIPDSPTADLMEKDW